jgi:hypothetical protein
VLHLTGDTLYYEEVSENKIIGVIFLICGKLRIHS